MTTSIRSALYALAAAALGWHVLQGAPPEPLARTGHVLILENARALEGDIERIGNHYRVKYDVGETWVPAEKVQRLCADMADAYTYLRGQANLNDPDEHLRLARWCRGHDLPQQALTEATQAVELRPSHAESRRLLDSMQRAEASVANPSRPAPEAEPTLPPAVEYNTESLGLFVTRVQPILMNACANCHATGRGGPSFKLTRSYANELTNRRATQQNLAAVLAQVNRKQPETSVLLSRAVTVHGEATQAPLKNRQVPAFKTLEEWVQLALTHEPRELPLTPPASVPEPKDSPQSATAQPKFAAAHAPVPSVPKPAVPQPVSPQSPASPPPPDPFDPMLFNGQGQPGQDAGQGPQGPRGPGPEGRAAHKR